MIFRSLQWLQESLGAAMQGANSMRYITVLLLATIASCWCFLAPPRSQYASSPVYAPTSSRHRRAGDRVVMMSSNKIKPFSWMEEVQRKAYEVKGLENSAEGHRLMSRLSTASPQGGWRVGRAMKRSVGEPVHRASVVAEIKRRTPTGAETPIDLAVIQDVALTACQLWSSGVDVLIINTDGPCYGGRPEDLVAVRGALMDKKTGERAGPPIVAKDLYIHPIQVAQAADMGADGVLLMACLLGGSLSEMLDACTLVGIEAVVEVHTVAELEKALELGATNIMATNWDRIENTLYPDQARALKHMIPDLIVSIAAGGITSLRQAGELADMGYDSIVLGRGLAYSQDVHAFITGVREREGLPSLMTGTGWTADEYNEAKAQEEEQQQ